ncbi:unnamed protein product [Thlaspi arvense]|uniref:MATH domain-containing protein n=1 Tax=Thlaspi arvense TaxID=13288 RepID=A0AAU9RRI7_THLAR|nr:unnamed protein product [Thlaspi arvense]
MEVQKQTSFTFEIDNFSEKEGLIRSPTFLSGCCEWYLAVFPKEDHLALYLRVANRESLRLGWKRRAIYSFHLLDQSGKELYKTSEACQLFSAHLTGWGFPRAMRLKKLQEKVFVETNKLIVKVQVKVVESVDESEVTGNETLDVKGFQVLYPQAVSVSRLFTNHPGFAANFKTKNQLVRTTYMNILLGLIEALNKPPHSLSETELSNARSELADLTEAGFKLDWLRTKLDEVFLERKKASVDGIRVQELKEQVKNLKAELSKEKLKSATSAAKLEEQVKNLKAELNKEKVKSATSTAKLEEQVKNLKAELDKEKKKSATSAAKVLSLEKKRKLSHQ